MSFAGGRMTGLWLGTEGLRLRCDLEPPSPGPGEVGLRVLLAGICGTDLELVRGYAGFRGIPGHEMVAVVDEGPAEWLGRRVVAEINLGCRSCHSCLAGQPGHCEQRRVVGIRDRPGAFAQRISLPTTNLHPIPEGVADEVAVFTEPLAAAFRITQQIEIQPGTRVLVLGDGRLGLLVAMVLRLTGCDLQVVGRHPTKLAVVGAIGIDTATNVAERHFDVVVDCSGTASGFADARRALRPQGTLVLKSTWHGSVPLDLSDLVVDEIRVVGSRCGPFRPALECLSRGTVDPRPLIEAEYPLEEGLAAFEHAGRRGARKILLRPRQDPR